MAFFTEAQARSAAQRAKQRTRKSDLQILTEARDTSRDRFDIFLSHSRMDKELVVGAKQLIEEAGYSVYVDWINDGEIDREAVDRERADLLRRRMGQCASLFYAHSPNAALSRWCPWELGYFDALKTPQSAVFILPILGEGESYEGQEYLLLYDTVDLASWRPARPPATRTRADPLVEQLLRDRLGFRRGPFL